LNRYAPELEIVPARSATKLKEEDIDEIRRYTHSLSWWARKLNVDQSYISYIRSKKRLAHLGA